MEIHFWNLISELAGKEHLVAMLAYQYVNLEFITKWNCFDERRERLFFFLERNHPREVITSIYGFTVL